MGAVRENTIFLFVFILAALLHGISGIGFPSVTTAAVATTEPLSQAVLLCLFPGLMMNLLSWLISSRSVWHNLLYFGRKYWLLAVLSLVGSLIGAKLLLFVNPAYLMLMLAAAIAVYLFMNLRGVPLLIPDTKPMMISVALIAGIVGGATNAMAPILIMYLFSVSNDRNFITQVGNMCYFLSKVAQIIILREPLMALSGGQWGFIGILTLFSIGGLYVGIRLRTHLPQNRFRQLVLVILGVLGLRMGWQGVTGLL